MNVPNSITAGRLLLAVVLFVLLGRLDSEAVDGEAGVGWAWYLAAALVFVVTAVTDALDGYLARRLGQTSDFGRIADPLVDKVVICGSFIFLTASSWARPMLPPWAVVLVVGREFLVTGLRGFIEARGQPFGASWAGKGKMLSQCFTIPAILVARLCDLSLPSMSWAAHKAALVLVGLTVVLTVMSGVTYVVKAARMINHE